jgi:hypothetical protein
VATSGASVLASIATTGAEDHTIYISVRAVETNAGAADKCTVCRPLPPA